jgi:glycosyltransferase involved in cell wall biosynthesis
MKASDTIREIIFFIPDLNGGGAERALLNLLTYWPLHLRGQWWPVLVVRRLEGPYINEVPNWVEVESLDLPRSGVTSSAQTVNRLAKILRKRHPVAVVTFLSHPSVVFAAGLARIQCKVIASVQNPPLEVRTDPRGRRLLCSRLSIAIQAQAYALTDFVLPTCPGIARQLRERFGVAESRMAILPNSVDLHRIRQYKAEPCDHPAFADSAVPVVVTAGRLVYQKGVDILIEAMGLLRERLQFRLVILGEGPERTKLERLVVQYGLADRVFFLGFQQNPWRFIGRAAVFVLASRYEGFGNVLIEAMACGTPVVTTAAPFGPEYIVAGQDCGLLVPVEDPPTLAHAIELALTDRALRARLAAGGLRRAEEFDVRRVFDTFWSLMQTLVAEQ